MMTNHFEYGKLIIEYFTIGDGEDCIICFHGFGRSAKDFEVFQPLLKPNQKIISINLFAHEGSIFPEERIENDPLLPDEWKSLLLAFLQHLHIEKFHLIGYSMGGRISLITLQLLPEQVKSILLIAPDGLKINLLYRFASETKLGRKIYRSFLKNPTWLFRIAKWLNKANILNDKLLRFVHVHMDTQTKRQQVYDGWLLYKKMFPELKTLAAIVQQHPEKPFNMIFGKYDSVIRPKLGEKFVALTGNPKHMHVVDAGHRLLTPSTVDFIGNNNLWP